MILKIKNILSSLLSNFVIFYLIPYKKKCYITCAGKSDGLGAQTQAIYSAMLYCAVNEIPYCHTPLNEIAHNYNNDIAFNETTEHFFSFSKNEKITTELKDNFTIINLDNFTLLSISLLFKYLFKQNFNVIFQKSHFHNFTNNISHKYVLIQEKIKHKFYTNVKKQPEGYNEKYLNIAYHIRRGDVEKTDNARYTDNQQIFSTLNKLSLLLNQLNIPYKFNIFSQGEQEDFDNIGQIASLHLNGNVFDDFYSLVKADVLFMAKSSFSYSAALLSDGIIIYEPFWHPPLKDWIVSDNSDNFPMELENLIRNSYNIKTSGKII